MVEKPIPDKLDYDSELFVNRAYEIDLVLDKARRMDAEPLVREPRVIIFYGCRGSGKTWLLQELENRLSEFITAVYLDLTAVDSVEAIVTQVPSERPLVLLLDEVNRADEGQLDLLEEYVLAPLAQETDVLVVLAERGQPRYWAIVEFREKSEAYDLGPFGVADIQAQMHKQAPNLVANAAEVQDLGGGYPWTTYLLARFLPDKQATLERSADLLLQGSDDLRPYLEAISVLRAFDEARMVPLLQAYSAEFATRTWDYAARREVRAQLVQAKMAYWEKGAQGYVVDEPIRRMLEASLRERDEVLWARLHCEACRLFEKWAEAYEQSREWWEREKEYHMLRLREGGYDPAVCPKLLMEDEHAKGSMLEAHVPSTPALVSVPLKDEKRDLLEGYTGARVTRWVGRADILYRIETAIRDTDGGTHLFYIEAPGGTGKTFLAREVLRRSREGSWVASYLLAARNEIDLYHHQARSREGFMRTFVETLAGETEAFVPYQAQLQHLQEVKYDLRGAINELAQQQSLLTERFFEGCDALAEQKRVVVALDTVERLVYETDRVQQALNLSEDKVSVRPWLLGEWLPRVRNAVILICGRPRERFKRDLESAVQACPHIQYEYAELGDFGLEDTLAYFRAIEDAARQEDNTQALRRLKAISDESRRMIHYLTDGHPITLALMIDYYLANGRLLPDAKMSLADTERMSSTDLATVRERVNADIIRQYRELGRPSDEVIVALAWTPKGMDAELLSRVVGMDQEEAEQILDTLADPHTGLSFVKIRPNDRRAFLHDEMYALMKKYVLEALPEAAIERIYGEILAYYADQLASERERVRWLRQLKREELQPRRPAVAFSTSGDFQDPQALATALTRLRNLLVEQVYYELRRDPSEGFTVYCKYADEALDAYDDSLDMALHDEMLYFLAEMSEEADESKQLERRAAEQDMAFRWIWRMVNAGRPDEVRRVLAYLHVREKELPGDGGSLIRAELAIWESWANAFLGTDLDQVPERLKGAIGTLLRLQPEAVYEEWRRNTLLARAYHTMGYLLRMQGRFQAAGEAYRRSLPLWHELRLEAKQAEALNNLAWVNAEVGQFDLAWRFCQDGLALREKLGHRFLLALSYNTLGLIEIRADQPHRGRIHCERALALFRELGTVRGVGLACTALSESHRCSAGTLEVYFATERAEQLRRAREYANQAIEIFRQEVPEPMRLVEALNELGCVYRDWTRMRSEYKSDQDPDQERLMAQGMAAFQEASQLAGEVLPFRQVDVLVNLAWLYFYGDQLEEAERVLNGVEGLVSPEYYITKCEGGPHLDDPVPSYWVQLGKTCLLRGQMAQARYRNLPDQENAVRDAVLWQVVTEQFTLALNYHELFSDHSHDMRQTVDTIYRALREANREELRALVHNIDKATEEYHLRRPSRMQQLWEEYFGFYEQDEEPQG